MRAIGRALALEAPSPAPSWRAHHRLLPVRASVSSGVFAMARVQLALECAVARTAGSRLTHRPGAAMGQPRGDLRGRAGREVVQTTWTDKSRGTVARRSARRLLPMDARRDPSRWAISAARTRSRRGRRWVPTSVAASALKSPMTTGTAHLPGHADVRGGRGAAADVLPQGGLPVGRRPERAPVASTTRRAHARRRPVGAHVAYDGARPLTGRAQPRTPMAPQVGAVQGSLSWTAISSSMPAATSSGMGTGRRVSMSTWTSTSSRVLASRPWVASTR